ncbi:MAG: CBS domain-containing protein [Nanoarchaeota archaeon]
MQLKDIMSKSLISIAEDHMVAEAIDIMHKNRISCIIASSKSKPTGILTERDLVKIFATYRDLEAVAVSKVMSSPIISLEADTELSDAIDFMNKKGIRHVLVKDAKRMGLVTQTNIVKSLSQQLSEDVKLGEYEKQLRG